MHINFQKFTRAAKKIRDGRIKYNGKLGRRPYLPESFEAEILKTISALRALKVCSTKARCSTVGKSARQRYSLCG